MEVEAAKSICQEESMTEKDVEKEMEIEQEKTRIRGEEFEKWQRESEKIERIIAKNAETSMMKEIAKETEREKAQIWCEADWLQYRK